MDSFIQIVSNSLHSCGRVPRILAFGDKIHTVILKAGKAKGLLSQSPDVLASSLLDFFHKQLINDWINTGHLLRDVH